MPAPFVYGFICSITGGDKSRYGMTVLMYWSVVAIGFLFAALISRLKKRLMKLHKPEFYGLRSNLAAVTEDPMERTDMMGINE